MPYRQYIDECFSPRLGAHAIDRKTADAALENLAPALKKLQRRDYAQANPLLELPSRLDDLAAIEALGTQWRNDYRYLVVAGAGGAGLSGRVLTLLKPQPRPLSLHFLDNIDPDAIDDCLNSIEMETSAFLIISKSGGTVETLSHFYILFAAAAKALGHAQASKRFTVVTTDAPSPLRAAAKEKNIRLLDHHPGIGGRFSVLTNVGLLPAAAAGLDIKALRRGALSVIAELDKAAAPQDCRPALGASLQYAAIQQGYNISVMLPYSERLAGFSGWYRQSWAESLGKDGKGSTPIRAVGTTDQHSQLQLFLGGPRDKLFHLILLKRQNTGQRIHTDSYAELAYLQGKTSGDVMAAEQKATLATLLGNQCPVRIFELDSLSEERLGALLMHFILEIIFMAHLLGVNPFDQPAVEEGKQLARDYLLTGNL